MKTTRHFESRSRAASTGPLGLFRPFSRTLDFPNSLLNHSMTRPILLKFVDRTTMVSAFSADKEVASFNVAASEESLNLGRTTPETGAIAPDFSESGTRVWKLQRETMTRLKLSDSSRILFRRGSPRCSQVRLEGRPLHCASPPSRPSRPSHRAARRRTTTLTGRTCGKVVEG